MRLLTSHIFRISSLVIAAIIACATPVAYSQTSADPAPVIDEPVIAEMEAAPISVDENSITPAAVYNYIAFLPMINGGNGTSTDNGSNGGSNGGSAPNIQALAQQAVELTNQYRAAANPPCAPLKISAQLTAAAATHSQDMATNGFFAHIGSDGSLPWDRIKRTGYVYSRAGENIAGGVYTAQQVIDMWFASEGHRANMLNCNFTEIGLAYADGTGGVGYGRYWTQVFATPR